MRAMRRKAPALDREVRKKIGEALHASFKEMLDQPIPPRHRDLLRRLGSLEATDEYRIATPYRLGGSRA